MVFQVLFSGPGYPLNISFQGSVIAQQQVGQVRKKRRRFDMCIWGVGWWKGRGIKSRRAIEEREGLQDKPNVSGLARFIFFKNISRLPHD
jgi:hypothetical protein